MKYQTLYDILNKYKGIMVDLDTGRVVTNGYGVIADDSYPAFYITAEVVTKDGEAFDTMVDRAVTAARETMGANNLLVVEDDGVIAFVPMNRTGVKEFALGWAASLDHAFIWNVDKRRPIKVTDKMKNGFWLSTPGEVIAVGDKKETKNG